MRSQHTQAGDISAQPDQKGQTLAVCTAGSALDGHIVATAAAPTINLMRRIYMCANRTRTVFVAEIQGIDWRCGSQKLRRRTASKSIAAEQSGKYLLKSTHPKLIDLQQ